MSRQHDNPFASNQSLDMNPFDDPTSNPYGNNSGNSVQDRAEELNRRERELAAREADLNKKAEHIRVHGRNNWPPFFPLIFHSIPDEIPEVHRSTVTRLYQLWLVLLGTLIFNVIACVFVLVAGTPDGGKDLGASIMYVFVIGVLSFILWYRPIYNGYMKEQALYYYIYFFFGGWHLLFSVYMIIGIPSTGSAGLIQTIQALSQGRIVAGVLGAIATAGWTIQGVGLAFYYKKTWTHHHEAGHNFNKAKGELAQHGAKAYFTRDQSAT